jgi:LemA protein
MKSKFAIGCAVIAGVVLLIGLILVIYGVKSYNKMVKMDEGVKSAWSQVENVYQRRLDLIPNLVETVKGYAAHEKQTFQDVTEARAKAGGVLNIPGQTLNNPEQFQQFQQAQNNLSSALQRLMVVVEKYPDLKANQNFLSLQALLSNDKDSTKPPRNIIRISNNFRGLLSPIYRDSRKNPTSKLNRVRTRSRK